MSNVKWRALKIGTGTFMAQAVTFLFLPVISRIYVPEEYGKLSIFLSLAFILIPLGTLKLDIILMVVDNEEEADNLLVIAILTSLFTSLATYPFTIIYFFHFENLTLQNAAFQSFLFSLLLFLQCLMVLSLQAALRMRKDNLIVASSFVQNSSISVLQVILGKVQPTGEFLVIGFIFGKALGIIPMFNTLRQKIINVKLNAGELTGTLKIHGKSGGLLLIASFFDAASISLPAAAIGILFGLNYSGILGVTQAVLTVPITLVGGAIGSVLISELAKSRRDNVGEIKSIDSPLNHLSKPLIFAAAVFTLSTFFVGPKVFEYLLGATWSDASKLIPWFAIPFGINFLWQPLSNLLYVESNWRMYLKFSMLRLTLSCLVGFSTFFFGLGWIQVASGFVFGGSMAQLIGIYWIWKNSIKAN
jgi:O-antigen/teichoic acid export membrane protein